jgi:hypothetical protein
MRTGNGYHITLTISSLLIAKSCIKENAIGIPYILMSKAPGRSLRQFWRSMSSKDKAKVVRQLGSITWQLCQLRFNRIGSLFEGPYRPVIKECLTRGLLVHERHSLNLQRGPFVSAADFYRAMISAFQAHASILPLNPRCFFAPLPLPEEYDDDFQFQRARDRWHDFVTLDSKIDGSDNRMDYIIVGDLLADMRSKWVKDTCGEEESYGYSLHHPDFSVNNIFIDEKYNITCIIDWAFCSSVPLSMAVTAPGLPQSRDEISEQLRGAFKQGFQDATYNASQKVLPEERAYFCRILHHSRPMWLLSRLLSFDTIVDYRVCDDLWRSIYSHACNLLIEIKSKQSWDHNVQLHADMKEEDCPSEVAERKHFNRRSQVDLTVSRKLALVSQWTSRYNQSTSAGLRTASAAFIADKTLWNWIDRCLMELDDELIV